MATNGDPPKPPLAMRGLWEMSVIPIVEHDRATPTPEQCAAVDRLAVELIRDNPELAVPEGFRPLVPETLDDMATLHLDDFSEIPLLNQSHEVWHLQQRARLRAGDGDFVVCSAPAVDGYEEYCRDYLGLGSPRWLDPPASRAGRSGLALACWTDRATRHRIIRELRCGELLALHPHMGTFAVWELAALLQRASRRPVRVIAPPPGVTRWVNNKIAFADTVTRLFGPQMRPRMVAVANFTTLSQRVAELAEDARVLVIKLPDSAGGRGNVVIDATLLRGKSLLAICKMLEHLIRPLCWDRRHPLGSALDPAPAPGAAHGRRHLRAGPRQLRGHLPGELQGRFSWSARPGDRHPQLAAGRAVSAARLCRALFLRPDPRRRRPGIVPP